MDKKYILGQYFTKRNIVNELINLVLEYKKYDKNINILEPSSGTGNFIKELNKFNLNNIDYCEVDPELVKEPKDFFNLSLKKKYDLIIGNPPFSKYNLIDSYFKLNKYHNFNEFLTKDFINKEKIKIETAFLLKSIKHLKNQNSSIAFVLPISFFLENKNLALKKILMKKFSTIIIYQNDKDWFKEKIPCCFTILTNITDFKEKIILLYENEKEIYKELDISKILTEELIPKTFLYKKNNNFKGKKLKNFIEDKSVDYKKSYKKNNISAKNILNKNKIPKDKKTKNYCLAITRVGNSSIGKTGLINFKKDILNDMFYVFRFKSKYKNNRILKEKICRLINEKQDYFKNISCRVGSKSIKKRNILNLKIKI